MTARLNVGCGPVTPADWYNIDAAYQPGATNRSWLDVTDQGLAPTDDGKPWVACINVLRGIPLGAEAFDGAVAHHVLQMVAWPDLVPWLTEVRRVLKPGAYLRLSVPDLELVPLWLQQGTVEPEGWAPPHDELPISDDHETSLHGKVCLWLSQAGATRSVFTGPWLVELCQRAGFAMAYVTGYRTTRGPAWLPDLDGQPDRSMESLYLDAIA